jgi:CzcA family heavy metal efflux pump
MLRKLIAFSLNNAALVLVLAALLLLTALYQVPRMAVDVFPELNAPTVVVLTEAGGLAADEVEQYVTVPIESGVNGLPGVRRVRSGSAMSLSLVYVEFDWGADIYRARQVVSEGLGTVAGQLPAQVRTEIAPISGITGEIMLLSLSSQDGSVSPLELRSFAEFDLRQRLLSVQGVAQVVAIGGELPEYQVNVRQDQLRLYDLTINDVVDAAGQAHSTASAGYLPNVQGIEAPLRQSAQVRAVDDIRQTLVKHHDAGSVTLGDVAEVRMGPAPPRGTASYGGQPAVVLSIKKAPFTNTLAITRRIDQVLDQVEAGLPHGMMLDRHVMRQADFIHASVSNVTHKLRDASIIVAVIVILFLLNVRASIITLTAIPLSIAMGLLFLAGMNMTLNVMTLGGLAIAVGEVVDDAIIDVENIMRRLRENAAMPVAQQRSQLRVIFEASNEIRSAIVFATVIIVVVFVPLMFLEGVEGRFFRPMGVAYIVAILASLVVALTVVPAMARYLFRGRLGRDQECEGFLVRWLKRAYEPSLRMAIQYRSTVLVLALLATLGSLWLGSTFGRDFLPSFNEGTFTIFIDAPPGTSLTESDRMVRGVDRRLSEIEGVRAVVRRTGRAERDEHAHGVNRSELEVSLLPGHRHDAVKRRIDAVLADLPGLNTEIGAPISHQLSHVLSGTQAAIAINIFGDDLATLRRIAEDIEAALAAVPGARDVLANREATIESLPIRYRPLDLSRWGLTPAAAAAQVEAAFYGSTVQRINEGVRLYDLVVRLHPDQRQSYADVRQLLLRGRGGAQVRLSEVADIGPENTPLGIQRESGRRKAVVSLNVAEGHNLGHVVDAVRRRVDPIVHRYGYSVTYGGQFEAQQSASRTLYLIGGFVGLVILVLLTMAFGSARAALLVMVNLPLALIGGIVAIFLTQTANPLVNVAALVTGGDYRAPVISIASMVGFVTLFGIAVRNGLLLVKHYAHLLAVEELSFDDAVIQGSMQRLVPILMTALTAMLGLAPLAFAHNQPGGELLAPLAVVVLGGLVTSTFLNLIVVPAGYYMIFKTRPIQFGRKHNEERFLVID